MNDDIKDKISLFWIMISCICERLVYIHLIHEIFRMFCWQTQIRNYIGNLWICNKGTYERKFIIYLPIYALGNQFQQYCSQQIIVYVKNKHNLIFGWMKKYGVSILIVWHKLFWSCGAQGLWLNCIIQRKHHLFMKRWYSVWAFCLYFATTNMTQNELLSGF